MVGCEEEMVESCEVGERCESAGGDDDEVEVRGKKKR